MFRGKRDELEAAGRSGTFYSIWVNAELANGAWFELDGLESDVIGNAYDELPEAVTAIWNEFYDSGKIYSYALAQAEAGVDDIAFIEVIVEQNDLDGGVDRNQGLPVYELFFHPQEGRWSESKRV